MKVKALQLKDKPKPEIFSTGPVNITCSAFGNADKMSGEFTSDQSIMFTKVIRSKDLFTIQATVNRGGAYVCTIKNQISQVQGTTVVNMFSRKYCFCQQS